VYDRNTTELVVTLQGVADATVLVQGLRVTTLERASVAGIVLQCPVGGASASPRTLLVDLDWEPGVVTYQDRGGDSANPFSFTLTKGEVEGFYVSATSTRDACCWVAELLLVVNGKRRIIRLDDEGQPFRTSGSQGLPVFTWNGDKWTGDEQ
jgi:hypothetical protein